MLGEDGGGDARSTVQHLIEAREEIAAHDRAQREQFASRLHERWHEGLEFLALLRQLSLVAGQKMQQEHGEAAERDQDFRFLALMRLHARSCLIASEIIALLESGHASGAFARWRSLHELVVVGAFLRKHGAQCAHRYLLHHAVQIAKQATTHQQHHGRMGQEPLDEDVYRKVLAERDRLVHKFGKAFGGDYGWAAGFVRNPTYAEIERDVDMDWWRAYYLWSSGSVHGGVRGLLNDIGQLDSLRAPVMLAGPSNAGLADPGQCAAISLHAATRHLLAERVTSKRLEAIEVMGLVVQETQRAFLEADKRLRAAEEELYGSGT